MQSDKNLLCLNLQLGSDNSSAKVQSQKWLDLKKIFALTGNKKRNRSWPAPMNFHSHFRIHCVITRLVWSGQTNLRDFILLQLIWRSHIEAGSTTYKCSMLCSSSLSFTESCSVLVTYKKLLIIESACLAVQATRRNYKFFKSAVVSICFWFIVIVYSVLNRLLLERDTVKTPSGKQFSLRIKIRGK